jgi:hypothetical protein
MVIDYLNRLMSGLVYRRKNSLSSFSYANCETLGKASEFTERFREIVSDPINVLIRRVPNAGYVDRSHRVILHNSNRVPLAGEGSYYGDFSQILILNRGVHEPLEEFCFQSVLDCLRNQRPVMLELGSYWAHYSMWLLRREGRAKCILVEPDISAMKCGMNNFKANGFEGEFINEFVSSASFGIDGFKLKRNLAKIDILHADIQGYEVEMLESARQSLIARDIDYVFISTHSDELHDAVCCILKDCKYRIEVSANYSTESTSSDGFVLATNPNLPPVFSHFEPMTRIEICNSDGKSILDYLTSIKLFSNE